ncbi:MAG: 2-amino-4-hydroxy-6-hydroxymethyldihydropteridine diphosphokinase [Bacteroidota bacterium]|nr:2-amino-4-hydroxy-6-hydroxymethyldihydropteridine diphosphokinase [Bacteroidota bacterium]MDP4225331.1 2-amino-4-hydroxy-6-hydroxymethyldihydropteridine diphosphokinase [Bacteroidota bacterium]MDP4272882.1 2-amino-4-hydroxy-6-hydroxymethyldihydropteridine diphosphokinase [Bacteroidota bacterium]
MSIAYLLLGGNLGDRKANMEKAVTLLQTNAGEVIEKSSLYESEPWGFDDVHAFYNQAVAIETSLNPYELLDEIHIIENELGRIRQSQQYASRTMDIDILFYDNKVIASERLTIPHLQLPNRRFVLEPMNELNPSLVHPLLNKSMAQLLDNCPDTKLVKAIMEN